MSNFEKVDVNVITKPISVEFECPYCEAEIVEDYSEFVGLLGDLPDWPYSKIECSKCEKTMEIDTVDWL